jgi:hypothetical protein
VVGEPVQADGQGPVAHLEVVEIDAVGANISGIEVSHDASQID